MSNTSFHSIVGERQFSAPTVNMASTGSCLSYGEGPNSVETTLVFVCGKLRTTRPSQIKPMHLYLKPWTHSPSRYLAMIRDLTYRSFELCSRWPRICPVFKS